MSKKFRVLSLVIAFCLMISVLPAVASSVFSDLEEKASEQVIERWYEAGLISGYPDGTFKPETLVTRAQFAKIISDLFVLDGEGKTYTDVLPDAWYYTYVNKASSCMPGSDNLFMPEQPMSMEDAVEILSGLINVPDEIKAETKGDATREEVILLIDEILGGETGFEYMLSVIDSHNAEEDEIMPLVSVSEGSDMVTFNDKGQVLLLSWHKYPESYIPGQQFTCQYGEMWTFTDKEVLSWYDKNHEGVTDWELRFKQLLGLPATDNKTHVSAFWVDADEIIRPAFNPDITKQIDSSVLDGSALGEYKEWFDGNSEYSYETSAYPWTRLGYTYDWLPDENEYGLSEFIILADSVIDVEWTKSFDEFLVWLAEN